MHFYAVAQDSLHPVQCSHKNMAVYQHLRSAMRGRRHSWFPTIRSFDRSSGCCCCSPKKHSTVPGAADSRVSLQVLVTHCDRPDKLLRSETVIHRISDMFH
ncbi:hypothetical protein ElyMa_005840700 [Elysia marginata]|uniref:Uncharacterized protein n=1 Tax=Elysia marginata TaxID=1093978 RepID=A0AAV4FXH5_9GAST|nr:hypothetical protein ElyMa_005840700 [Elysia marginata]